MNRTRAGAKLFSASLHNLKGHEAARLADCYPLLCGEKKKNNLWTWFCFRLNDKKKCAWGDSKAIGRFVVQLPPNCFRKHAHRSALCSDRKRCFSFYCFYFIIMFPTNGSLEFLFRSLSVFQFRYLGASTAVSSSLCSLLSKQEHRHLFRDWQAVTNELYLWFIKKLCVQPFCQSLHSSPKEQKRNFKGVRKEQKEKKNVDVDDLLLL